MLRWLLHRHRLRLRDLPGIRRGRLTSDLKRSLGNIAVLAAAGAASNTLQHPFFDGALPPQITVVRVRWALAYGVLIWPALWVTTEELVYLGYALPRLEARLGLTRIAAALVILCWGLPSTRSSRRCPISLHHLPRAGCAAPDRPTDDVLRGMVGACSRSWWVTGLRMSRLG